MVHDGIIWQFFSKKGIDQSAVASHADVSCINKLLTMFARYLSCLYYDGLSINIHYSNYLWFIYTLCTSYELYTSSTCLISQLTRNPQISER